MLSAKESCCSLCSMPMARQRASSLQRKWRLYDGSTKWKTFMVLILECALKDARKWHWRQHQRMPMRPDSAACEDVPARPAAESAWDCICDAIDDETDRKVCRMVYEGYEVAEVRAATGLSRRKYYQAMSRIRRRLAFKLAAARTQPEAVLFTDSLICSGFAMGCRDAKLDIPRTLSVAGFEDDRELENLPQSIASVRISAEELARQAVRFLLAQCRRQAEPPPMVTMHTLQIGGSIRMR